MTRHRLRGRLLVLCAATLWGTTATLARFVFRDRHVPALTVVELRLTITVVLLGIWLAARRPHALLVRRGDIVYLAALGLFGVATVQGGYYYSISVFGVGLAILLQYLAPTLIVLYDMIRGRPVTWRMLLAVACAVGGTALLVGNIDLAHIHAAPWQWAIGFSTSVVFAFYVVFSKRGLERYAPETVLIYSFLVAGAFWAIITPPSRILAAHYDVTTWGMFLALGVFSTLVPFTLFYSGLRHLPAAEAGIFATLEPVVAVIAAAVFLHEGLSMPQWLGAALVLTAAILASIDPRTPDTRATMVGPPGS